MENPGLDRADADGHIVELCVRVCVCVCVCVCINEGARVDNNRTVCIGTNKP